MKNALHRPVILGTDFVSQENNYINKDIHN